MTRLRRSTGTYRRTPEEEAAFGCILEDYQTKLARYMLPPESAPYDVRLAAIRRVREHEAKMARLLAPISRERLT